MTDHDHVEPISLGTIARTWGRIGCLGFGGPPAHIGLLRDACVGRGWLTSAEFDDGVAATSLLPGPASTQLAIYCAWKLRRVSGALIGGLCFIIPGLVLIIGLSAVFLAGHPPRLILGLAAGAGAAVPAVALRAAGALVPASRVRLGTSRPRQWRWGIYMAIGAAAAATVGTYLVVVLVGCGLIELAINHATADGRVGLFAVTHLVSMGGLAALAWVAFTVGALSFGGGFVIVPLMQHDAVSTYHWMSGSQFLNAVALGQITPGPVVLTIAVVGYAARGVVGALIATAIAFGPSFLFVIGGGSSFDRLRTNARVQSFLSGAGPCVIGAIAGSAIPLGRALAYGWQFALAGAAIVVLFGFRRQAVEIITGAAIVGLLATAAGAPIAR